jgi:uncharacterized membrane protein YhfC
MYGWTLSSISSDWVQALIPFWERFWAVAFHIGAGALTGYGLARGWGWQFYLLSSFLHGVVNYSVVLLQKGLLTINQGEIYIAAIAALIFLVVLWLRWRKGKEEPAMPIEAAGPAATDV